MSEEVIHYAAVTFRVNGTGNLRPTFYGFDNILSEILVPLVMNSTPGQEPTRLSNFKGQRARLKVETTAINEVFRINRIIIYAKPIYTQFPG